MFHDFRTVLVRGVFNLGGEVSSEECRHVQLSVLFFLVPIVLLAVPLFFGEATGKLYERIIPEWQARVLSGLSSIRNRYPSAFNPSFASGARSLNELKGIAEYYGNRMPDIDPAIIKSLDSLSDDLSSFIFALGGPEKKLSAASRKLQASAEKFTKDLRQACGRNFCDSETRDLFESVRRALAVLGEDSLYSKRESEALADMLRETAAGIDGYSSNIISVRRSVAELEALSEGLRRLDVSSAQAGIDVSHLFAAAEILDAVQDMLEKLSAQVPEVKMTLKAGIRRVHADVSAAINQIAGGGALREESITELAEEIRVAAGILGDDGIAEDAQLLFSRSSSRLSGLAADAARESNDVGRIRTARTQKLLSAFRRLHPLADPLELLRHDLRALKKFLISTRKSSRDLRRVPAAIDRYLSAGIDLKRFAEYADTAREASDSVKLFTAGGVLPENTYFEDREISSGKQTASAAPEGTDQAEIQLGREQLVERTMDEVNEERAEERRRQSGLPSAAIEAMNSLAMALENESSILREISLGGVTPQNIETYLNTIDAVHSRVGKLNYDANEYRIQKRDRKELVTALRRGALCFGSIIFVFIAICECSLAVRRLREAGRSPLLSLIPLAAVPLYIWASGKGQYIFRHPSFDGVESSERAAWLFFIAASLVMLLPMLIFSLFTRPAESGVIYNPRIYGDLPDRNGKPSGSGSQGWNGAGSSGIAPEAETRTDRDEELLAGETWNRQHKKKEEEIPAYMLASASDNPEFTAALLDVMGGTLSGLVFIFAAGGIPDWILSERKAIALKLTAGGNSGDPEIFSDYYLKSFGMEGGRSAQGFKDTIKNCCGDQINYLLKPENSGIRGEMMTALAGIILADASLSNRKRFVFRQLAELLKISPFAADKYMNDAAASRVKKSGSSTVWNSVPAGAADRSSMFIHVTPQRPLPGKGSVASPLSAGQSHGVVCAMSEDEAESAMAESAAGKSQGAVTGGKTISEIRDGEKSGLSPEADAPAAQSEAEPEAGGRKKPAASSKNRRGAAGRSAASEPDAAAGRSASGRRQAAKAAETEAENDSSAAEEPAEKKKKPAKRKSAAKSSSAKSAGEKEASVKADPAKKTRAKRAAGKSAAAAAPEIPEEIPSAEELEYAAERKAEEDVAPSPDVKVRRSRLARAFGRKSNDGSQEAAEESSALENDALMSTAPEPAAEDSGTIGWDSVFPAGADVIPDAGAGAVSGQGKKGKGKGKKAASEEGTIGWDSVFPEGADGLPDAGAGAVSGQGKKGKGKGKKAASEEGTIGWDSVFPEGADGLPDAGAGAAGGQGKKGKGKDAGSEDGTIGWDSVFPGGIPDAPERR